MNKEAIAYIIMVVLVLIYLLGCTMYYNIVRRNQIKHYSRDKYLSGEYEIELFATALWPFVLVGLLFTDLIPYIVRLIKKEIRDGH